MSNRNIKKVMLVGQQKTGKTSIIHYLIKNRQFESEHYPSVGVQAGIKTIQFNKVNNDKKKQFAVVQFWDTAGNHQLHNIVCQKFYDDMDGFIIVTDLSNQNTLKSINFWYKKINQVRKSDQGYFIGVVANKSDLPKLQFGQQQFKDMYGQDPDFRRPPLKFYGSFSLNQKVQNNTIKTKIQQTFQRVIRDFYDNNLPTIDISIDAPANSNTSSCSCSIM